MVRGEDRDGRDRGNKRNARKANILSVVRVEVHISLAMAAVQLTKKALSAPPTVRTLASGIPSAPLVNLAARAPAHGHGHGHGAVGPRSDVPPKWAGGVTATSSGLVCKTFASGLFFYTFSHYCYPLIYSTCHRKPAGPTTGVFQHRLLHTSVAVKDAPNVPDFSGYQAKSEATNRGLSYFMIGSLGVLTATAAKSTVTEFLSTMSASADVLALAKVEIELASIPEGKNVILKWRGKPVFIRHRTQEEIEEARNTDWKALRDPESDESRTKKPEWLVMLGVCTHLGCVPIGEAGDYGGWCVSSCYVGLDND